MCASRHTRSYTFQTGAHPSSFPPGVPSLFSCSRPLVCPSLPPSSLSSGPESTWAQRCLHEVSFCWISHCMPSGSQCGAHSACVYKSRVRLASLCTRLCASGGPSLAYLRPGEGCLEPRGYIL
ncbi:unnamed protein product [Protopolystoma xenopodis]|uniref:Uncharacterized protein n=1 Tax=Protopolystoma xenopodis TaxID=117903 RepID=A0A3S5CNT2_9PLAT|nr:unnamed protein product [Protopolystoma xenopodis]